MRDLTECRVIAQTVVDSWNRRRGVEVVLDPSGPLHVDDDFAVWAYNTPAAWDGDVLAGLAGNGPIVVDRRTGVVGHLPTSTPWRESLEELRGG